MGQITYRPYAPQDFNALSEIINATWGHEKIVQSYHRRSSLQRLSAAMPDRADLYPGSLIQWKSYRGYYGE